MKEENTEAKVSQSTYGTKSYHGAVEWADRLDTAKHPVSRLESGQMTRGPAVTLCQTTILKMAVTNDRQIYRITPTLLMRLQNGTASLGWRLLNKIYNSQGIQQLYS